MFPFLARLRRGRPPVLPEFEARSFDDGTGLRLNYRLFKPAGSDQGPTLTLPTAADLAPPTQGKAGRFPLVICLHGAGGAGSDNVSQLLRGSGIPPAVLASPENQGRFPAFIMAPQCPREQAWRSSDHQPTPAARLLTLALQALQREFPVDGRRIYAIGISMGGHGVWDLAARFPGLFAALVPICAAANPAHAGVLAPIPVWCFHGAQDQEVPVQYTRKLMEELRQAGGQPKYTELPGVGHSCTRVVFQNNELLPWLFSQVSSA